jgi:hypothetical protein
MSNILILYILAAALVSMGVWVLLMELRLKRFFRGKKAGDLEDTLRSIADDLKNLQANQEKTENYLKEVEERLKKSLKQVGLVRYNPFAESGSNQSFSIAFLDEKGDGAVVSGLYTRENIKVYAKPIKDYKSEYTLTPEEEKAIKRTKDS